MINDLKKLFQSRFPEISLVAAFQAFGFFFMITIMDSLKMPQNGDTGQIVSDLSDVTLLIYSVASMVFYVLWAYLILGFLATVSIDRDTPHAPVTLISFGRRFFWRSVRFYLLFSIYGSVVAIVLFELARKFLLGGVETGPQVLLANRISQVIAWLVLVKLLLVPAIMIVYDCMVLQAMSYLRQMKIFKAKYVILFTVLYAAFGTAMLLISNRLDNETALYTTFKIIHTVASSLLLLLIGLSSVWYVNGGRFGNYQPEQTQEDSI